MIIQFFKYHGTGNDFVIFDGFKHEIELNELAVVHICHRRFGIGADGVIVIKPHAQVDFEMIYYNNDGKLGSMCGNGARCVVAFALYRGYISPQTQFMAPDGLHTATVLSNGDVRVEMRQTSAPVRISDKSMFVNTGSPHYVTQVDDIESVDMNSFGRAIRYSPEFEAVGVNVNVYNSQHDGLYVRTYERGVEDETYSCGTGVTAVALVSGKPSPVQIMTRGGRLTVEFSKQPDGSAHNIFLTGPAVQVFSGAIDIDALI